MTLAEDHAALSGASEDEAVCFVAPASFAQKRLWFIDRLQPNLAVYSLPAAWRMRGRLDKAALQRALDEIEARHETLRTTFEWEDGEPVQVIAPPSGLKLRRLPLIDGDDPLDARIVQTVQAEADQPFDLSLGPLVRASLIDVGDDDAVLILAMHHIISDLWSLGVISNELWSLYAAFRAGEPSPLEPLAIQYADFAAWQRERLHGERLEGELTFWRSYLDGAPEATELPTDHPRPTAASFRGAWEDFELEGARSNRLRALSAKLDATLFMTVAAMLAIILSRWSGREDVVFGYPVAGRNRKELEPLVGLFINTLVLRVRVTDAMTFRDVVDQVREGVLNAHDHQDLPFERLVEDLKPVRDTARQPIFQVAYSFVGLDHDSLKLSDLDLEWVQTVVRSSKFDLTLSFTEAGEELWGGFEYSTDLFDPPTAARLVGELETLLNAVLDQPDRALGGIEVLPEAEQERLKRWETGGDAPAYEAAAHAAISAHAAAAPSRAAITDGARQFDYGEFDAWTGALAARLEAEGVGEREVVGICVKRGAALAAGMVAALKAGCAFMPLDPDQPSARLATLMKRAGVRRVLVDEIGEAATAGSGALGLPVGLGEVDGEAPLEPAASADDLAYCIATSGSTGEPKLVQIEHRGLAALVAWHRDRFDLTPGDRAAQVAGPGFDACVWEVFGALCAGAELIFAPDEIRADAASLASFLDEAGVTHAFLPTPVGEAFLASQRPRPGALRHLMVGGDRLSRRPGAQDRFEVVNCYGPTEASVVATAGAVWLDDERAPDLGGPIAGCVVRVLDRRGERAPTGVAGELAIAGAGLARGYLGDPRETAARFRPDPFGAPGARVYLTGDRARWLSDGRLEFLGRMDRQIQLRGLRVEPGEVEAALNAHPDVRACLVDRIGRGAKARLAAWVETGRDDADFPAELRSFAAERLPTHMTPGVIAPLAALPLTANGKIDRAALPDPAPQAGAGQAPQTETQRRLAAIWGELLTVNAPRLDDDFFALGGQSLMAIELGRRVREAFRVELRVRDIFENPSLGALARAVDARSAAASEREEGEI